MSLLLATILAIAGLFTFTMFMLFSRGKILAVPALLQALLFGVLYFQIFNVYGSDYYNYKDFPHWYHWIEFTAAHVLRAGDIFDVLEESKLRLQNLQHNHVLVGCTIVTMHWITDIFLIAFVWQILQKRYHQWWEVFGKVKQERRFRLGKLLFWCIFGIFLVLYGHTVYSDRWRPWDSLLLWPLDNLIRVIDVGDTMQIFHWKLHRIPDNWWNSSLAVVFRIISSFWLAYYINTLRMLVFRGKGLTMDKLIENLKHEDAKIRKAAARAIGNMGENGAPALVNLILLLKDEDVTVQGIAQEGLEKVNPQWRTSEPARLAVPEFVRAFHSKDAVVRKASLEVLGTLNAQTAVPLLIKALEDKNTEVRKLAKALLQKLDADWNKMEQAGAAISRLAELIKRKRK